MPRNFEDDTCLSENVVNFRPFEFFHIHSDFIDKEKILYNGRDSTLLVRLPIKTSNFGESLHYYPAITLPVKNKEIDEIYIYITDEYNRLINFNSGKIQYDISFLLNE